MPTRHKKSQSPWILVISGVIVLTFAGLYFGYSPFQEWVKEAFETLTSDDEQRIQSWVEQYGLAGPLVLIATMVVQMFLFVIPSFLLMVISILAYGPFWGSIIAIIAVAAASSIAYWIGHAVGASTIDKFIGKDAREWFKKQIDRYGVWAVIVTKFSPLLSNDAVSFIAGFMDMGYWKFILATLVGITPLVISIAIFSGQGDSLKTVFIWISVLSLAGLVLKVALDKWHERQD